MSIAATRARSRVALGPSWRAQPDPYRCKVAVTLADTRRTAPDGPAALGARSPPANPARTTPGHPRIVRAHSYCKRLPYSQEPRTDARLDRAQRLAGFSRTVHVSQPFEESHLQRGPLLPGHAGEHSPNFLDRLATICRTFQFWVN